MQQQGGAVFRMDGRTVFFGAVVVFASIIFVVTTLPLLTFNPPRSADARPLTAQELRGRTLYAANGCMYCHSQYLRPQDWTGVGSFRTVGRVAEPGDYYYLEAPQLGTERTGPDLSQEGGVHPDEWHYAHFYNPRYAFPKSIMPQFSFYYTTNAQGAIVPTQDLLDLVAYVQSLGGRAADDRTQRQRVLKQKLLTARAQGNEEIIHEWFPTTWRTVRNPMEPTLRSLVHGKQIFTTNCVGCHGVNGDGKGPAAGLIAINGPTPRNFTDASQQLFFSDGELYDAILFGVDGTAMPSWGDILTVNDIWDVTNFIRTIPNGGLQTNDLNAGMMISPPDIKPIEVTPLPEIEQELGGTPITQPQVGPGQTGPNPGGSPTPVPTSSTRGGAPPARTAAPATPQATPAAP